MTVERIMATQTTTCPYCNAYVPDDVPGPCCPRCGERIPGRASSDAIQTTPRPPIQPSPDDVPMPARFSNRAILLTILAVMVTMAAVGFLMAWETVALRRANDVHLTKPEAFGIPPFIKIIAGVWMVGLVMLIMGIWRKRAPGEAPASPRTRWVYGIGFGLALLSTVVILLSGPIRRRNSPMPGEDGGIVRSMDATRLEGLGYLPEDTNIIAGVHVGELVQDAKSREFLDDLKIAALHFSASRLENWTGLKRENIDYVLLGLKVEDQLMPRTTIIARSRTPLDGDQLREKLRGVLSNDSDPNRFHFRVVGTSLEAEARCLPEERLIIVGLTRGDLEAVPTKPRDELPPRLAALLKERVDRSSRAWAVGQVADWERTPVVWWINRQSEKDQAALKSVRAFAASVVFEDPLKLRAEIETTDAKSAQAVVRYLWSQPTEESTKVTIPGPVDAWVSVQATLKPKAIQDALQPKN